MCYNPKWIYKKGNYKESNYRGEKGSFYELGTYSKCGSCAQCQAEKNNNWVIRNAYEAKCHDKKCFVTLTYAENPIFLVRKDLQDFMKRFRFEINKEYYKNLKKEEKKFRAKIKKWKKKGSILSEKTIRKWLKIKTQPWREEHKEEYIKVRIFYAGEYGTVKGRSHFHVIIYGWEDENAKYLDINKKTNILYQSDIIHKCWGLGRTSYQAFGDHEAPYVALYNTPQETFKSAYKMTMEKAKEIEKKADNLIRNKKQRENLLIELKAIKEELAKSREKYYLIKEFNGWSQALGWEQFEKEYNKQSFYNFEEYFEDKIFVTPSPWVKKLANEGDIQAAMEMFRREEEIIQSANEEEERQKNLNRTQEKRKKELLEWHENGRKNGEIDTL